MIKAIIEVTIKTWEDESYSDEYEQARFEYEIETGFKSDNLDEVAFNDAMDKLEDEVKSRLATFGAYAQREVSN